MIAAFERIFGATIFFGSGSLAGKAKVVHRARFNFFREAQIWYNRAADESVLSANVENVIVLSDEFFQEIMAHPIPTDLEAVKLLKPRKVIPSHYNTWPPIAQDANQWAERVRAETKSEPIVVSPGQTVTF